MYKYNNNNFELAPALLSPLNNQIIELIKPNVNRQDHKHACAMISLAA